MIEIVPYDNGWPAQFLAEATCVREAMGRRVLRIEHVGSTAVPGLAAKPVIDIQVSVASLETPGTYTGMLAELGYRHIPLGPFDRVYPFFQKPAALPGTHHIHLCVQGSEQEKRHLAFRDCLRKYPAIAAEYVQIKRALAAVHDGATFESCERYSLAKTPFVSSVLAQAME